MKKDTFLYVIISMTLALSIYNFYRSNKAKIASIDTAKVLKAYKSVAELTDALSSKNAAFKSRLDTLANEFQIAVKEYERRRSSLSEKEIVTEENKLRQKQDQYTQFKLSNQEGLKNQERKIIEQALEKINSKIIKYAKQKGYCAVLGVTPTSGVIYASDYIDITNEILEIIND